MGLGAAGRYEGGAETLVPEGISKDLHHGHPSVAIATSGQAQHYSNNIGACTSYHMLGNLCTVIRSTLKLIGRELKLVFVLEG